MEFDVVAESPDRKTLLVGEAKLSLTKTETWRVMDDLKRKAGGLPFAAKYENIVCRLFVAESAPDGALGMPWILGE